MALQFDPSEYGGRQERLLAEMRAEKLDALLLFAQESMFWLTGFDSFGYSFFQCLVVKADGAMVLLTRSPDMRQARHTSTIERVVIWADRANADPTSDLKSLLDDMDLLGGRIGVEYDTHGLTGANCRRVDNQLQSFANLLDASSLVSRLRLVKSEAEISRVRRAAELADAALDAALPLIKSGTDEAEILAAMQGAVLAGGGDYPANPFVIGSGTDALLTRYKAGRRKLDANDQLTLQWAGVDGHYHAVMMRTIILGGAGDRHRQMYAAAREALEEIETILRPGNSFGDVFATYAGVIEAHGLTRHRLNACGYSLGARFSPSWAEPQMFFADNPQPIEPNMVLFPHMVVMDSDAGAAMTLGQTYVTTDEAPQALSRFGLDLITC